jgi:putative ABC transport system permease protein
VAVIGAQVYKDLFEEGSDPLGQKIRINGIGFRILGVMEEKGSSTQDTQIFIPVSAFQRYITGSSNYAMVNIQAADLDLMRDLQRIIEDELLKLHRLPNMDTADFYIANQLDLLSTVQGVTGTFTLLLGSIAAISLIVGGIGIMNIMLVSVTERTREIGVRMALGAKSKDILGQFLTEAIILSVGGGLIGILLGVLVSWAASRFGGMASVVSIDSIILAFGFAVVTGLFFGGYPAFRASRLDPIEALRYE